MKSLSAGLASFWRDESGAAGGEYALLLAVVVLVAGAVLFLGSALTETLSTAADCVETGCN